MQPHVQTQTAHLSPTHGAAKPQSPSSSTSFSNSGAAPSMSSKTHEISATTSTISSDANQQQQQQQSQDAQKPQQRKIGRWFIGETLGKGGYSWVKKGRDEKNGKFVALKFVDRKKSNGKISTKRAEQIKTEITVLKNMKHPNIVRLFAYNMKAKYPERDNTERDVMLLVLEYMAGGELFDILYYTNALSEVLARTYFSQLISGVEALHNACINHRDLKPQNLLLDKRFNLKITDFGLSKIIESDEDAIMHTFKVGTRGYQAPEILLKKPYTSACDIFACGVILFLLLTGYPPFQTATAEDKWYGNIARGKAKKFWKQHRGCGLGPYATDLITKMLSFDPNQRISLPNIKKHPWFCQELVDSKDLRRVIQLRHTQMEVKRASDPIKQGILEASEKFRGGPHDDDDEKSSQPPTLPSEDGIGIFDVFTTHSAKEVLTYIQNFSKQQFGFTPELDMNEFSTVIRTAFQSDTISAEESMCEALISIFYYSEYDCNVVKFVRMSGEHLLWNRTFEQLMVWLRPVLDGAPEHIIRNEMIIEQSDEQLLEKYFTSPREAAIQAKIEAQQRQSQVQVVKSPESPDTAQSDQLMDLEVDYGDDDDSQ